MWPFCPFEHGEKDYYDMHWTYQEGPHPEITNAVDRASSHYQNLLLSNGHLITLNIDNLHLENEAIKLAKLFEYQNAREKKLALVKELLEQQGENPELNWMSQKDALFELALSYNALGEKEKAYETYSFIHATAAHFPTAIASHATLESARIHFELLKEDLKNESNEEILTILNDLKELQIRKNASSEPTHLEAALEYAKIRSMISDESEKDARYLFFLSRIKDDFTSQEDLVAQDYLVNLNRNNEKKKIFDSYMKFIDAEKMRLEAKQLYQPH